MTEEVKPSFRQFNQTPELYENEILGRVFMPFSDLHWMNLKRMEQLRKSFMKGEGRPSEASYEDDWEAKDDNGNYMPGNITGEIYWTVHSTLPVVRLGNIKQLALLAFSTEGERNFYPTDNDFSHTRLFHSYVTPMVLECILKRNGFPQGEIGSGIIAANIHDLATPPYGDPTKEIDPELLDEEKALERLLGKYDLKPLEKFGATRDKILSVVRNEDTVGKLLDIADKIAYTAVDIYFYAGDYYFRSDMGMLNPTIEPIRKILRSDPKWANIYQEVSITNEGEPYFKDPKRLGRFLELRARMHKALYLNPHCRGRDYMFKMLAAPLYSREPHPDYPFNSENLMFYTDEQTGRIINNYWNIKDEGLPFQHVLGVLPDYIEVSTDKIDETAQSLKSYGVLAIGAETIRKFDPAIHFLTVDPKDKQIKPYRQVNPKHAAHLQKIVEVCNRTVVYFCPPDSLVDETWGKNLKVAIANLVKLGRERNDGKLPHYTLY